MVHQMQNTTPKAILAHPNSIHRALAAAAEAGLPTHRIFQFSDRYCPALDGVPDWTSFISNQTEGEAYDWPRLSTGKSKATVATINFSSGTTGLPKGVRVSHANLIANIEQTTFMRYAHKPYAFESRPQERWIGFLP
ncbi:AMP-binding protein, partial [Erythrobacter sp. YJ-T3-07]|uniref:AMP-binding protein n=1 Tax=Erythrobacter sp. YJ-T3-07 TaxID=2793063 RepID=UPI0034D24DBA